MEPRDLEKLGKSLQEALTHQASEHEQIHEARAAFLQDFTLRHATRASTDSRRARGWWRYALAASLGAGAAVGVWFWPRAVSFQVGEARTGQLGDVIEALDGRPTPLQFSEGSRLLLHEGARMRVLSLDPQAARVLVEDGVLDVSVAHTKSKKARWDFEAGPYRVQVTGTKFRMAFLSHDRSFSLSTQEGQVLVTGGCQQVSQKVSAGESIDLTCPAEPKAPSAAGEDQASVAPQVKGPAALDPAVLPAHVPATNPSAYGDPTWRGLLAAGQLSGGLAAARRFGFQRACRMGTAKELLALADGARLFGSPADAIAPLRILRERFARTTEAATAAFRLGLIAFEREHAYAEATRWFDIYLRDQPSGPLMGDAFGRVMQSRSRAGDTQRARSDAQQYLRKFPEGPYALEARGILSR
jgi:transmembrane sensor